ncbi:granzyme C [Drosophila pseudoobscura]|uniref:trypsin n=1 Tax=Drosophila pseudoobscura pseudoobscura TaxID=46245 RepID=A0A6I8VH41_DROPS|nr:granzyme C [Drosophila pseudoobscura]
MYCICLFRDMLIVAFILRVSLWSSVAEARRGVVADLHDRSFEMLIAGGHLPDSSYLVRHIVSIRTLNYIEFRGDNHFCSGILLSSRAVLTAAHCVTDWFKAPMNPRALLIVFGSRLRLAFYDVAECRRVDRLVLHPEYKRYKENDLAVLQLSQRIPSNMRHVRPLVTRDSSGFATAGKRCITMGWGQVYPHGPYSNQILALDVLIRNHSFCEGKIPSYNRAGHLCAEPDADGEFCPGDMGGPLICEDWLAGIIGGSHLCEGGKAMKFTNYMHHEKWIQKTVLALTAQAADPFSPTNTLSLLLLSQLFSLIIQLNRI